MEPGRFFFVLSFVSMLVLWKKKGKPAWKVCGRDGSEGMHERAWISMTIDWRIGLDGWKEDIVVLSNILLSSPLVM